MSPLARTDRLAAPRYPRRLEDWPRAGTLRRDRAVPFKNKVRRTWGRTAAKSASGGVPAAPAAEAKRRRSGRAPFRALLRRDALSGKEGRQTNHRSSVIDRQDCRRGDLRRTLVVRF